MRRSSSSSSSRKKIRMCTDRCGNNCGEKCHAKEAEKNLKYKSLNIQIKRMWNMQHMIVPVITGATGIVIKGLKEN